MPTKPTKLRVRRNIPEAVKIGRQVWEVQLVRGLEKRENLLGHCDYDEKLITLDADLPQDELELTLAHELLHAIFPWNMVGERLEEKIVRKMERQFLEVLRTGVLFKIKKGP